METTKATRIITIDKPKLESLFRCVVKVAITGALIEVGVLPPFISQKKAYELYGEMNVRNWIKWGKVEKIKDGDKNCKVRLSRLELEAAAQAFSCCEWFDVNGYCDNIKS